MKYKTKFFTEITHFRDLMVYNHRSIFDVSLVTENGRVKDNVNS